ncbi:hypothetical protein [Roseovarius sp. 2305UL8-3]|uniref:hypothetical protein n=1 Tax=Roseovarius conchicola TaxID=3121636 RepID=UPI0035291478
MTQPAFNDLINHSGIHSLEQIATRDDRVCVLNIVGNESRIVTPVSHAYSGGNIVFGTSPGRQGMVLETPAGDIPVFDNVRSAMAAGLSFDTGVVYLPPNAVRDGVAELVRINPDLKKVIILTEKVPVRAAREIRAICHARNVDVFGANCLGVADSWNQVRIGGALGGDAPEEVLIKGSIAIYSNSGNFTNTIATYLSMAGWGTTTLISSGKDLYIQYGPQEFAQGFNADPRSKAAVIYAEPGGYYEKGLRFDKPVVACVVGKWKSNLTRAVGHAGALAGSGDDAEAKEAWLRETLGVSENFTPENPVISKRGAVVTNLSHVHMALNAVMKANGTGPDFAPRGGLELKAWFGNNQGLDLPPELDLPIIRAIEPYASQIDHLRHHVGATFVRQSMKDASGATKMDPKTQVTSVYGETVLNLSRNSVASNIGLVLTKTQPDANQEKIVDLLVTHAATSAAAAQAGDVARMAHAAGNTPNTVLAAALALIGPATVKHSRTAIEELSQVAMRALREGRPSEPGDLAGTQALFADTMSDAASRLLKAMTTRAIHSPHVALLQASGQSLTEEGIIAALCLDLGRDTLSSKRISLQSLHNFPWMLMILGTATRAALASSGIEVNENTRDDLMSRLSVSEMFHLALTGDVPDPDQVRTSQIMTGIVLSNGPGTISAQGAKGAVSADGPEIPERVQLNKAMIGFLTHAGYSHGGNGFECVEFLLEQFAGTDLTSVRDSAHGLDIRAMARAFAETYKAEKTERKSKGQRARALPGINHPVFRGAAVNVDPREEYISDLLAEHGQHNVLLEFYKEVVQALHDCGATRNVFCVNVDAVIACLLLDAIWDKQRSGVMSKDAIERAAFNAFLFGRIIGSVAEIDDHLNRGKNMDTRSPASQCRFVT